MDTRTGQIIELSEETLRDAEARLRAWQAGLLKQRPRLMPVSGDHVPARKRKRRRTKATRSYRDYCR